MFGLLLIILIIEVLVCVFMCSFIVFFCGMCCSVFFIRLCSRVVRLVVKFLIINGCGGSVRVSFMF